MTDPLEKSCLQDLRLEITIKNNILWHAIFDKFKSIGDFCRQMKKGDYGFKSREIHQLLNFSASPFEEYGGNEYTLLCRDLSNALGKNVEDLFPRHMYEKITVAKKVIEINSFTTLPSSIRNNVRIFSAPTKQNPVHQAVNTELREKISEVLHMLLPRERQIIKMRFGLDEYQGRTHTFDEIATVFSICPSSVKQAEKYALEKLRRPFKIVKLLDFVRAL